MVIKATKIYAEKKVSEEITKRADALHVDKMDLVSLLSKIPFKELKALLHKYL